MDIGELLDQWGLKHLHSLFIEQEFTIESFSDLQYDCLVDLFPKAGPRNQFWAKYKSHFSRAENLSQCTTISATTFEDTESVMSLTPELNTVVPLQNVIIMNLEPNNVEAYLNCANGIIIKNYYSKNNSLDNKSRNSLANLIINAEFNSCINKPKFLIKTERFIELTSQILKVFPKEPEYLYYIKYNPETRSVAKGKLWESYNYLKKRLRNIQQTQTQCEEISMDTIDSLKFLESHFEPIEDVIAAWKVTFKAREKLVESPTSITTIVQYFEKFPVLKGPSGSALLLIDFEIKYPNYANKLFENWALINSKIIRIADAKQSAEIQLVKQQKCAEILMLCILPFLLPHAYLKKKQNSKRVKLTKQEILENIFIHVTDGNLLNENIAIHLEKLKKYNRTFQPMVVFVGDTLNSIIASYVIINDVLFKTESPLAAIDLCFKAFHVLNATYPEGSQMIWHFIQKIIYGLSTRFDLEFISVNSLINEISQLS